jgi:hypothetical protein
MTFEKWWEIAGEKRIRELYSRPTCFSDIEATRIATSGGSSVSLSTLKIS